MKMFLLQWIVELWQHRTMFSFMFLPFSWIFQIITWCRHVWLTRIKKPYKSGVPVIIVGNISVGGTGKTPLVAWLASYLQQQGYHPGIVMRGYKRA